MNYTKGPWEVNRNTGVLGVCGIEANGSPIASVNQAIPEVEANANANLIVAAPDMYEALKELANQEDWDEDVPPDSPVGKAWAAMSKAEGWLAYG